MKKEEAEKKLCPFTFSAESGTGDYKCYAQECMAWISVSEDDGYCVLCKQ